MRSGLVFLLLASVTTGCASLADEHPTRPPRGVAAAQVPRDAAECQAYAKGQPRHHGDHYVACMVARSYAANVDLDELGWVVGLEQTRPHDPRSVLEDVRFCDRKADNAKNADVVPLTPEQEASISGQAVSRMVGVVPGLPYQQRPNATRMLVACLAERGYAIVPWVPMNEPR